jgi:CRP-like cAMP-binding protein
MTLSKLISTESSNRKSIQFESRSPLPLRRDALWQIQSGAVRTFTWLEDGNLATLGIWGTGDVVSHLLSPANPYEIECLTPVEATLFPLTDYPQVNEALIRHVRELQKFLEILHIRPLEVSLVYLLTWLAKKFGREVDKGKLIDLRLTHQELAEMLGTSRVTVTRSLNVFEQQGIIERLPRQSILLLQESPTWYYEI